MTDKKHDFDGLDFSKLQQEKDEAVVAEKTEKTEEVKVEAKKTEPVIPKRKFNAWINGEPIEDVSTEDMGDWVFRLLGVTLNHKDLDTPNKRVKTIDKVVHVNSKLSFMNLGHHNKDHKVYKN